MTYNVSSGMLNPTHSLTHLALVLTLLALLKQSNASYRAAVEPVLLICLINVLTDFTEYATALEEIPCKKIFPYLLSLQNSLNTLSTLEDIGISTIRLM